jgi:oxalate decarboxylase/phosphoglucose isomerase-like protein (cupin superfamily)
MEVQMLFNYSGLVRQEWYRVAREKPEGYVVETGNSNMDTIYVPRGYVHSIVRVSWTS